NALCVDLLRLRPQDRPDWRAILRQIGSAPPEQEWSSVSARGRTREALLLGRQQHLGGLREALRAVIAGRSVSLLAHGRSGVGKTALMHHFLNSVADRGEAVVLMGRCYEREAVPFK